jgi:hypothetical protein
VRSTSAKARDTAAAATTGTAARPTAPGSVALDAPPGQHDDAERRHAVDATPPSRRVPDHRREPDSGLA